MATKGDDALLIALLASGSTIKDAAAKAGMSETTAPRRLANPEVQAAIADARAELLTRTVGYLADATAAAARTLVDLLQAEGESVRLGAARTALEQAAKLREHVEHGDQLRELREPVAALTAGASR